MSDSLYILGIRVDRLNNAEVLDAIEGLIHAGGPHHVVTVNPEFVVIAQSEPRFRQTLLKADLALPDGIGLLWASRFLGRPLSERVTGTDTVDHLAALCARRGYRPFLLGGQEGVAEAAGAALKAKYPGLNVAGTYAGSPRVEEEDEILQRIRAVKPHLLFVAYGAPRQDEWIYRNLSKLGDVVALGVGGAFDFISGRVPRCPLWLQRIGLEWLYRLAREPWRWRRMLRLPRFVWLLLRFRSHGRFVDKDLAETYTTSQ